MKKLFIATIFSILMTSCYNNSSEETSKIIVIRPGYKVVNAMYTYGGTVSILIEKADSNYIPTEKILTAYLSNGTGSFSGSKRYYKLVEQ